MPELTRAVLVSDFDRLLLVYQKIDGNICSLASSADSKFSSRNLVLKLITLLLILSFDNAFSSPLLCHRAY